MALTVDDLPRPSGDGGRHVDQAVALQVREHDRGPERTLAPEPLRQIEERPLVYGSVQKGTLRQKLQRHDLRRQLSLHHGGGALDPVQSFVLDGLLPLQNPGDREA